MKKLQKKYFKHYKAIQLFLHSNILWCQQGERCALSSLHWSDSNSQNICSTYNWFYVHNTSK